MSLKTNSLVALIEECIQLKDCAQSVLSGAIGEESLSRLERLVLMAVTESDFSLTVPQIGRTLGHTRQSTQKAANKLLELGLVEKAPNPDHKTAPLLKPTARGFAFERKVEKSFEEIVAQIFTRRDLKQCDQITSDIKKIKNMIRGYKPG